MMGDRQRPAPIKLAFFETIGLWLLLWRRAEGRETPTQGAGFRSTWICGCFILLASAPTAGAYTLIPPECKDGTKACIESGKLAYVSVYGPIRGQDLEVFQDIDYLLPRGAPFPTVYVNSPGGRQRPAMSIGRILRDRKAEVRSGSPIFPDRRPECSSACAYVAAGAVRRYLTHIGIHSGHFRQSKGCGEWEPVGLDEAVEKETEDYLREMGIPVEFDKVREKTQFNQMKDFVLDGDRPIKSQKIAELGFFQGDKGDFGKLPEVAFDLATPITDRREYIENAAILGLTEAMWDLVEYLNTAKDESERDPKQAFDWLKRLAARNDAYAHYIIGNYYSEGWGTGKSDRQAMKQYVLAAEQGVGQAQAIVGQAYLKGRGMPQDVLAALNWSLRAAERGEPLAYRSLCEIFGTQASGVPSSTLGATWCKLAVSSDTDVASIGQMEQWQDHLTREIQGADLERVQDLAVNWRPLQEKSDQACGSGAERY